MKTLLPDLVAAIGLIITASGVWMISPAWALIIVGLAVIGFALLMARR